MSKERIIEISSWIILAFLLIIYVPVDMLRHALVIFLFKQFMTWIFGHVVVELGLIKYPVRFFKKATSTSFTFEFFAYPALCVFFNLYYPFEDSIARQMLYFFAYTSGITVFEYVLERHTKLIKYIKWNWFCTWITILLTFLASNMFYRWFFQI